MGKTKKHTLLDRIADQEKAEILLFVQYLIKYGFFVDMEHDKQNKIVTNYLNKRENKKTVITNKCICIKPDNKQCRQQKTSKINGPDSTGKEVLYNPDFCDIHNKNPPQNSQVVNTCVSKKSDNSDCGKPAKKSLNDKWYCGTHFNKTIRGNS